MTNIENLVFVLIVYMSIVIGIGYYGFKKTKATAEDYYLGGRGLGTLVLTGTLIATYASLWTFMGAVGGNYRLGITFVSMMVFWNILWPTLYWVVGSRVWILGKKYGYLTYSQMVNDYYGTKWLGVIAAIFGIFALLPYIAVQLMGGGAALGMYTHHAISFSLSVIIMFIFMVLIIAVAGAKSVVLTDTFQGLFFLSVMIGLAIYAVHVAGGFNTMFHELVTKHRSLLVPGRIKFGIWIGFVFTWGFAILLPHMFQRMMMAKNPEVIARTSKAASIASGLIQTIPVFILGIAAAVIIPNLTRSQTDLTTIIFSTKFLPEILSALVIGGAFAAGTSTLNSQLLSSSSLVVEDLVKPFQKTLLTEKEETFYGKLVVISLGLIVLVIALVKPGLIVPISTAGVAICISSYVYPLVGLLFWPGAGKIAAYSSMISAGIVSIITWLIWKYPLGIYNVLWGLIIGGIVFFVVGLVEKQEPLSQERRMKYHELTRY